MTQAFLGNHSEALALYEQALHLTPGNAAILSAAAEAQEALGDYASAIYYAEQARRLGPDNKHYYRKLAELQLSGGHAQEAARTYESLLQSFPEDVEARFDLAQVLTISGRVEDAIAAYEGMLSDYGSVPHVLRELLQLYIRRQDSGGQERTLRRLVDAQPHDADVRRMLADLYVRSDRPQQAVALYRETLDQHPGDVGASLELSKLYRRIGRPDSADVLLQETLAGGGTSAAQLVAQAGTFFARSNSDPDAAGTAERLLERALELDPSQYDALVMLGQLQLRREEYARAGQLLYRAAEENPRDPQLWYQAAAAFLQDGDAERAADVAGEALLLFPGQLNLLRIAGYGLMDVYRNKEAIARFEEALRVLDEQEPDDLAQRSDLLAALGLLFDRTHDLAASDSAYSRAVRADGDNSLALNNYAYSLASRSIELEKARKMARHAVSLQPENPSFLDTLGWVYFQMDEFEEAVEWLEKAVETGRASSTVLEHLGDAHHRLGNQDRARAYWQQALEKNPEDESAARKLGHDGG